MLRNRGVTHLDLLYITNYDEDHVSGLPNLLSSVNVSWIWRNGTVSPQQIQRLKSEDGMGPGIARLVKALTETFTSSSDGHTVPSLAGVTITTFFNSYPQFEDENNLSMVVHLALGTFRIMFTGDMETAGFAPLLEDPVFVGRLKITSVFVAPHHGRISGCCDIVASHCKPFLVIVSDKAHMYETQKTQQHYYAMAKGDMFRGEQRHVLTTRRDGTITIDVNSNGEWWID